jgi:hypothetical protein
MAQIDSGVNPLAPASYADGCSISANSATGSLTIRRGKIYPQFRN